MQKLKLNKKEIEDFGYTVIPEVYKEDEIIGIINQIELANNDKSTFRKTDDLFAIRQFLKEVPSVIPMIFNERMKEVINQFFGNTAFCRKIHLFRQT